MFYYKIFVLRFIYFTICLSLINILCMTYALPYGLAIRNPFEENSIRCLSFPSAKLPTLILIWYIPHKHLTTFIPVLCFSP